MNLTLTRWYGVNSAVWILTVGTTIQAWQTHNALRMASHGPKHVAGIPRGNLQTKLHQRTAMRRERTEVHPREDRLFVKSAGKSCLSNVEKKDVEKQSNPSMLGHQLPPPQPDIPSP